MTTPDLFAEDAEYNAFVEKFKPKKTTDDCYTPEPVYNAVRDYVCERWKIDPAKIVRPFWPGGDYERFDYPPDCVVLDNPPFSIVSKIEKFYIAHNIRFFIFAPGLTMLSSGLPLSYLCVGISIYYENGAKVNTGFVHNLDAVPVLEACPELHARLDAVNEYPKTKNPVRKLSLPLEIITAARLNYLAGHGVAFCLPVKNCQFVRQCDNLPSGFFGSGYLIGKRAAAERAAAEWIELSEREKYVVDVLSRREQEHD